MSEQAYVHVDGTPLYFTPASEGSGWMLCCVRGIPCEGHVQAVSHHVTNSPNPEEVRDVVLRWLPAIQRSWNGFVEFARGWNDAKQEYGQIDPVALLVLGAWCRRIIDEAEQEYYWRTEREATT